MKKIIRIVLFLIISIFSLAALKDGSYCVEGKFVDGWQPFLKLIVKNEKIIGAQYDRKNAQSQIFSIDQSGNESFKDKNGISFRDVSFSLTRSLIKTQDVNAIEDSRVPELTREFKTMMKFLIEKANLGTTGNFTM